MGDFTKRLTQRNMLNRPGGPPIDLDELRKKTPQEGLEALISPEACNAIGTLAPEVAQEVGKTLVALGDALARVAPPALRLDVTMVAQGWYVEVRNQGKSVYTRSASMTPTNLCKLILDGVTTWAHYAADVAEAPEAKAVIYGMWAEEMAGSAMQIEDWQARVKEGGNPRGDSNHRVRD